MSRLFSPPCSAERKSLKAATPFVVEYVAKPVWPKNTSDCFMPTSLIWLGQEWKCFALREASLKSLLVLRWLTVGWQETFLQFLGAPLPRRPTPLLSYTACVSPLCTVHRFCVSPTCASVSLFCAASVYVPSTAIARGVLVFAQSPRNGLTEHYGKPPFAKIAFQPTPLLLYICGSYVKFTQNSGQFYP